MPDYPAAAGACLVILLVVFCLVELPGLEPLTPACKSAPTQALRLEANLGLSRVTGWP